MPIFIIHHIKHLITCTTPKTALRNDTRIKRYIILKFGKIHTQQGSLSGARQKRNPSDPRSADLKRRQTEANHVRTSAQQTPLRSADLRFQKTPSLRQTLRFHSLFTQKRFQTSHTDIQSSYIQLYTIKTSFNALLTK